jgi:hypothetical protein
MNQRKPAVSVFIFGLVAHCLAAQAATFNVANGDVAGFRAAVISANGTLEADTILLAVSGDYSFSNIYPTADPLNRTALPIITSNITIDARGSLIRRADSIAFPVQPFRLLRVSSAGSLTLKAAVILNGDASPTNGDWFDSRGGGLRNDGGTLVIEGSRFEKNKGTHWGGAVESTGPTTITNSVFINNTSGDGGEGAINASGNGTLVITNTQFTQNSGDHTLAISNVQGAVLSQISIVKGANQFGVLSLSNSAATIKNCTITGGLSAGLSIGPSATATVTHCTITDHGAVNRPGRGISVDAGGSLYLRNSVLAWNDNGPSGFNKDCAVSSDGQILQNVNNVIGDGTCSPMYSGDPKVGPLDLYGGKTLVLPLYAGSIAVDHAEPVYAEPIDQRGVARPLGAQADIGAYEGTIPAKLRVRLPVLVNPAPYIVICDPLGPYEITVSIPGTGTVSARSLVSTSLSLANAPAGSARFIGFGDVNRDGAEDLTVAFRLADVYRGAQSCRDVTLLELQGVTSSGKDIVGYVAVAAQHR